MKKALMRGSVRLTIRRLHGEKNPDVKSGLVGPERPMPRVIGKNLSDSAISANALADAERSLRHDRGLFSVHPAWCKHAGGV